MSFDFFSFFCGCLLGMLLLGSATFRTISIYDGKVSAAVKSSVLVSLSYWLSLQYVISQNVLGYIGFALGEMTIVFLLSKYRNLEGRIPAKSDISMIKEENE